MSSKFSWPPTSAAFRDREHIQSVIERFCTYAMTYRLCGDHNLTQLWAEKAADLERIRDEHFHEAKDTAQA